MKRFLLLTDDAVLGRSLDRYVTARGSVCAGHPLAISEPAGPCETTASWVIRRYEDACDFIDGELARGSDVQRDKIFAVADFFDKSFSGAPEDTLSNPARLGSMAVVGMLVLTYPEIHWLLLSSDECACRDMPALGAVHVHNMLMPSNVIETLDTALTGGMCTPEFDPTGLRRLVRALFRPKPDLSQFAQTQDIAIVLDEEYSFASLVALATYRTGLPTRLICTERLAYHWLSNDTTGTSNGCLANGHGVGEQIAISIEDVYVSFPDSTKNNWASLRERDDRLDALAGCRRRYLLTVGQGHGDGEPARWNDNLKYLRENFRGANGVIHKPVAGIHQLLNKTGLMALARGHERRDIGPGPGIGHHGVEGRIALVCENLLKRSAAVLQRATSVEAAAVAAVIAIDARELLATHAPTLALEAVALQHEAEVQAESSFIGIAHSLRIDLRIKEIRRECRRISRWFSWKTRLLNELNARLAIVDRLATRFAVNNQADEAEECRAAARILRANYMALSRPWAAVTWPLRMYIAQCLRSLGRFLLALGLCFFGLAWYLINYRSSTFPNCAMGDSFLDAGYLFISGNEPSASATCNQMPAGFIVAVCVIALIHTGLLISHIYTMASRR